MMSHCLFIVSLLATFFCTVSAEDNYLSKESKPPNDGYHDLRTSKSQHKPRNKTYYDISDNIRVLPPVLKKAFLKKKEAASKPKTGFFQKIFKKPTNSAPKGLRLAIKNRTVYYPTELPKVQTTKFVLPPTTVASVVIKNQRKPYKFIRNNDMLFKGLSVDRKSRYRY